MKKTITFFVFAIFLISGLHAQLTLNGTLDSSLSFKAGSGDYDPFSYGIEEYANIRFQSRLRDGKAVVYGAVNLIAASGDYAVNAMALTGGQTIDYIDHNYEERQAYIPAGYSIYATGTNYIAGIELERLYFRLNFEKANFDGGLFRLPFGYSSVWGSSDFLNPKNPLKPDARPRGILGMALGVFPVGDFKIGAFAVTPQNPLLNDGSALFCGFFAENHWGKASAQLLYSFETPGNGCQYGIHRAGFSLKADIEVGLVLDALYIYNHEVKTKWDGLSFCAGLDYSFFDGKLIVMAEYLYNGDNSSTSFSADNILGMPYRHYMYSGITWLINDFTNINIALISCLDNVSFIPLLIFNHDLFQGASLMIMAQVPIGSELIDNGNFIMNISAKLRLRF